jgi:hypothetical protein
MTLAPAVPVPPAAPPLVALDDLRRAAAALRGVAVRTPLLPGADALPAALAAADVWLKPEMLQRGGAFKLRGAYTFLARLDPAARARAWSRRRRGTTRRRWRWPRGCSAYRPRW